MAIRNSLHFYYDGKSSKDFGIINVNIGGSGMLSEPFLPTRSIKEIKVAGNLTPYHQKVEYEPLEFPVNFAFNAKYDREHIRKVARWLCQDYYKPLTFSEEPNKIFYALFIGSPELTHNGANEGYISLDVRCDSPFSYSPVVTSPLYDFSNNISSTLINIENQGDTICKPELDITKIGNGNISIINLSDNNTEFKFTGLLNNEQIYVNNERQHIRTNLAGTYRFNEFNNNYLELLSHTINNLKIIGNCKIRFRYQYKYLQ